MADPGTVSGLVWRLEAKDTTGLTTGDPVATAVAAVGSNATQATSAFRPTFQSSVFGTQPAFRFDGVDDHLKAPLTLGGTTGTWFFVGVQRTLSGIDASARYYATVNSGANDYDSAGTFVTYRASGAHFNVFRNSSDRAGGNVTVGTPFVACVLFDGTNVKVYVNGTVASSVTSSGTFSITEVWLAVAKVSGSAAAPSAIDVGAVLAYDRALTLSEIAAPDSYAQDTYGITVSDYTSSSSGATVAGALSTASSLAPAGSVSTGTTIGGALSTATALAPAGAVSTGATLSGAVATATAMAHNGAVDTAGSSTVFGLTATGTSLAPAGAVVTTSVASISGETGTATAAALAGSVTATATGGTPAVGDVEDGFPVFDTDGDPHTTGGFIFEPPVVFEATAAPWPARITMPRGISVLKSGGSYRQVRVPTDDEVRAADIAYIGGGVYPVEPGEADDLTDAGYGDRLTEGDGTVVVTVTGVDDNGFPYVDTDGATDGEEAELTITDGFPVFTTS